MKKFLTIFLTILIALTAFIVGIIWVVNSDVTEHKHVEGTIHAVAPTCTESGLTKGIHCKTCKEVLKAQEVIPALGHAYDETGKCTRCEHTRALEYEQNEDGTYTVVGIGDVVSRIVIIPSEYNGKAVTSIAAHAFEGQRFIGEAVIPASVVQIGEYAFKGCYNLDDIYVEATYSDIKLLEWNSKWNVGMENPAYTIHYGLAVNWEYDAQGKPREIEEGIDLPIVPLYYTTQGTYASIDWFII